MLIPHLLNLTCDFTLALEAEVLDDSHDGQNSAAASGSWSLSSCPRRPICVTALDVLERLWRI